MALEQWRDTQHTHTSTTAAAAAAATTINGLKER